MEDLFENQDLLPKKVRAIVKKFDAKFCKEGDGYQLCEKFLAALLPHGYTFEYGLDAVPYDLQKVGTENRYLCNECGGHFPKEEMCFGGDDGNDNCVDCDTPLDSQYF